MNEVSGRGLPWVSRAAAGVAGTAERTALPSPGDRVPTHWQVVRTRQVALLGVPTRFGTAYPGCEHTPSLLRAQGLLTRSISRQRGLQQPTRIVDRGDVRVPTDPWSPDGFPLRCLDQVLSVAELQAPLVESFVAAGHAPLLVGGDCTTMLGTVAGLRRAGRRVGLVCFDAHGDFNTAETTPSGNLHGMTVAAVSGRGAPPLLSLLGPAPAVPPERITLLGVRDLDPPEAVALTASSVAVLDPQSIRARGARASGELALGRAVGTESACVAEADGGLLLHLDLDVLDPSEAPGVGLPVSGGLSLAELLEALEPLLASDRLLAVEITEAAPALDPSGRTIGALAMILPRLLAALATPNPADE